MRILLAPNRHTVIALALLKHLVLIRVQFTITVQARHCWVQEAGLA